MFRVLFAGIMAMLALQFTGAQEASAFPSDFFPSAPGFGAWTYCAQEGETCYVQGPARVRYGANGRFNTIRVNGPVPCNNSVFGDPNYGVVKHCEYILDYNPGPGPGPRPGPGGSWEYCADEDGVCYLPYPTTVRYGVGGRYTYIQARGSVSCSNNVFGDPAYGQRKSCFFQVRY